MHFFSCQCKIRIGDQKHNSHSDDGPLQVLNILEKNFHPDYRIEKAYFDVSILETTPLTFSRSIYPICLPPSDTFNINEYNEKSVQLIGWGSSSKEGKISHVLKRVPLTVFPTR